MIDIETEAFQESGTNKKQALAYAFLLYNSRLATSENLL